MTVKNKAIRKVKLKKPKGVDSEFCYNCGKLIVFNAFMLRSNYTYIVNHNGKKYYTCGYGCNNETYLKFKEKKKPVNYYGGEL